MRQVVLEAITPSKIGGAELCVIELCRRLPQMGVDVKLFTPVGRPFTQLASKQGLQPFTWDIYGKFDVYTLFRLVKLIRTYNISVVHTHLSTAAVLGGLAAKIARVPSCAHVHGLNSPGPYRFVNRVIAVSEAVKKYLLAHGLQKDVQVVYNGVDLERFSPADGSQMRVKYNIGDSDTVFGVFGRLSEEKGIHIAVKAFGRAFAADSRVHLFVVGDGKMRAVLHGISADMGVSDRVHFTGFLPDFESVMAACNVVLVPSIKEGFGLTAVNAMAMQRPVIASNVGGLPEVVDDAVTGVLLPPGDVASWAEAMRTLARERDTAIEYGIAGRKRAEEKFEINRQISYVKDILLSNTQRV